MPGPFDRDSFFGASDADLSEEDRDRMFSSDYLPGRESPQPAQNEGTPADTADDLPEPAWYEDMPRKFAAVVEGASLNAADNVLPEEYGGRYMREAGHAYPTLRGLGTAGTGIAAAAMVPGAQTFGGSIAAQGILGAAAGVMGADDAEPGEVASAGAREGGLGALGGGLGYVGGQLIGKGVAALGGAAKRVGSFVDDAFGGVRRPPAADAPPPRYDGPLSPNDLEQEWLARGRSIPAREMPTVKSNDPYSQALQRTRDEITAPVPPPAPGPPSLMPPSQTPPADPFHGRADELVGLPPEPMPAPGPAAPPDPFVNGSAFRQPAPEGLPDVSMRNLPPGRGWRKNFQVDGEPPPREPWSEPPPEPPLELADVAPQPPRAPSFAETPPTPPSPLELDPSVAGTRRVREAPYLDPGFVEEARFGIGAQQASLPAPPPAAPAAPPAPAAPGMLERGLRTGLDVVSPRAGRLVDRMAGGPMPPMPTNPVAAALGRYGSELAWESGASRAKGDDGGEPTAYAGKASLNYAVTAALHGGNLNLSPADERALTSAVVNGDDAAIRAADFRLRQRYPAYARRVEHELRDMNEESY